MSRFSRALTALRRPRNATPVPFVAPALSILSSMQTGPREEQMRAMSHVGTLYSVISVLSTSTASASWKLYRKQTNGERVEVTAHAALDLWNKPNPFQTRAMFVEAGQQYGDLTGEIDIVISRAKGFPLPLELWLVRPDKLTPIPDPVEFIAGFEYAGPSGEKIWLDRDDVMRIINPDPLDPYRGLSPVQSIMTKLEAVDFADSWNRNFFVNGAEPGGVIRVDHKLSDEDFEDLKRHWQDGHKGTANAHRVAILEEAEWQNTSPTARDMQFVELSTQARETIREAYGVPKFALGLDENVNRATAEASDVVMAKRIIRPRLERWKELLNTRLLPMYPDGQALEFDFDPPEPDDEEAEDRERTSKVNAAVALIGAGFDPAGVLEAMDLPEIEFEKPEPPVPPTAPDPPSGDDDEETPLEESVPAALGTSMRLALWTPRAAASDVEGIDLAPLQVAWEAIMAGLLDLWPTIEGEWRAEILRQIEQIAQGGDYSAATGMQVPIDMAVAELADAMVRAARDGGQAVAREADAQGVAVEPQQPRASDLLVTASSVIAFMASEYAISAGRELLRTSGPMTTPAEAVQRVADHLASLTDARPQLYFGDAITQAQRAGRVATFASAPVPAYYASEVLDANTCKYCRAVHGRWLGNDLYGEVAATYPTGGYVDCLGKQRCRGQIVGVWREGRKS